MDGDPLIFECPRCGTAASAFTYGPCGTCRDELRMTVGGKRRDVEVSRFEPHMHVVPNHVATKD